MIYNKIRQWAGKVGILDEGDIKTQSLKLQEEVGELAKAILYSSKGDISDAIGDAVIVLTSIAYFNDTTIEECIESAYNNIKDRKGAIKNGDFQKYS